MDNSPRPRYKMRLSLNVLDHLGLSLYSNVPAVLAEVVANAWDADAQKVDINLDSSMKRIVIKDDGTGMSEEEINNRFLFVGYRRREEQQGKTARGRNPMGRKGIGKLSLFSIANEIFVETARDGERNAFRMSLSEIRKAVDDNSPSESGQYEPEACSINEIDFEQGTRITLKGLQKLQTISTASGLRKRLARRFSIIGQAHNFDVSVNSKPITPEDRAYCNQIQYAWVYGDEQAKSSFGKLSKLENRDGRVLVPGQECLEVSGWLGTVHETKQLRDELEGSLNRVAIFVRGKMAQEDILGELSESGVYASYLIGELRVNGLDRDDQADSATSSRQRILEDDPRYLALKEFIKKELGHIESQWRLLRSSHGVTKVEKIREIKDWIKQLPKQDAKQARQWISRIYRIRVDDQNERRELLKQAVIGFEFHRWNENIDSLESIADNNLEAAINVFKQLDILEANIYGKIVKSRIEVIRTLQEKVAHSQKERAIQQYIYDHLWLLDPNWERVDGSEFMETKVTKIFESVSADLTKEERDGRLDIKYRKTAGQHVIIELKKPDRVISVYDLAKQVEKYRTGMKKLLDNADRKYDSLEFICLLGNAPREWNTLDGKRVVEKTLEALDARYMTYDMLLENAFRAYQDYLEKSEGINRLNLVMSALDKSDGALL